MTATFIVPHGFEAKQVSYNEVRAGDLLGYATVTYSGPQKNNSSRWVINTATHGIGGKPTDKVFIFQKLDV